MQDTISRQEAEAKLKATIETDEERTYFLIDIPCHPYFVNKTITIGSSGIKGGNVTKDVTKDDLVSQVCPKLSQVVPSMSQVQLKKSAIALIALSESPSMPISALMQKAGETNRSRFRTNILSPLIESQLVEPTQKDSPQSPKQEYTLTDEGKEIMK